MSLFFGNCVLFEAGESKVMGNCSLNPLDPFSNYAHKFHAV